MNSCIANRVHPLQGTLPTRVPQPAPEVDTFATLEGGLPFVQLEPGAGSPSALVSIEVESNSTHIVAQILEYTRKLHSTGVLISDSSAKDMPPEAPDANEGPSSPRSEREKTSIRVTVLALLGLLSLATRV
ncbi:UNVERIFIED_CONTAM: hypothetical protein Sradi_6654000 [Sesamum radiatum]|uniref:Uncharacterized protein n=1 Tax=Sesamum radiatum TaxID=300843 RepID=A0AAW2JNT2_SESRA